MCQKPELTDCEYTDALPRKCYIGNIYPNFTVDSGREILVACLCLYEKQK